MTYLTESFGPGRNFVLNKARQTVLKQTKGKYPAPLKALEAVEAGFAQGIEKGLEVESKNFGELGMTPASKALISIFNGSNALKKNPFKEHKSKQEVKTIGVVGAGLMGAGIAGVSVEKGFSVVLKDVQHPALARGEKQVHTYFQEKVKKKQLTGFARDRKLSSLIPIVDTTVFEKYLPKVDLLLEAVLEELSLKHKVLQQIEPHLPSHAIIATNTSAIPIQDIASGLKHPERLVGMHYFSPVEKMPLLEIILGPNTSLATAAAAFDVGLKQGKTVIVAKDVPGFYVNRSLGPYMAETMALLYQGADIEKIDKAMKDFGMPVGPIALADEVGLDVAYHVQHTLRDALGQRMAGGDDSILKEMMSNKFLGKKAQSGFFDYSNPKEKKKPVSSQALEIIKKFQKDSSAEQLSVEEIQERLVARLVNEAIFCLQDKIIDSPVVGDIGLVFGIGFPPFLGGPFRYVDSIGTDKFYDRLKKLSAKYGPQFEPAPLLAELKGKPFHDQ